MAENSAQAVQQETSLGIHTTPSWLPPPLIKASKSGLCRTSEISKLTKKAKQIMVETRREKRTTATTTKIPTQKTAKKKKHRLPQVFVISSQARQAEDRQYRSSRSWSICSEDNKLRRIKMRTKSLRLKKTKKWMRMKLGRTTKTWSKMPSRHRSQTRVLSS